MQVIYGTHLPISEAGDDGPVEHAVQAVGEWIQDRFGFTLAESSSLSDVRQGDTRVSWSQRSGRAGLLWEAIVDHPNQDDPLWRWRAQIYIGYEPDGGWLRVRINLYSSLDGLVLEPQVQRGRPGIMKILSNRLHLKVDGWRLDEVRWVYTGDVSDYVAFLLDPKRKLPVVVLSTDAAEQLFLEPRRTADRLMGLAHVVCIGTEASLRVSEEIGKSLSCYRGAVRIYWPRFTRQDDPYHHALFIGGTLTYLQTEGLLDELFRRLGQLSSLSVGVPLLRERLLEEERDRDRRRLLADVEEATRRRVDIEASPGGGVDAETWSAFAADYDKAQDKLEELQLALLDAQIEIEAARSERDSYRANLDDLISGFHRGESVRHPATEPRAQPTSIVEATTMADEQSDALVFLPEALDSARASRYPDPQRVLDDLLMLGSVAREWAAGRLPAGPHHALKEQCPAYRDGISPTALNMFRSDYVRSYGNDEIVLGPHIRRGVGAPTAILRIYFYFDTDAQRIVVGHVGRKLRDASNP